MNIKKAKTRLSALFLAAAAVVVIALLCACSPAAATVGAPDRPVSGETAAGKPTDTPLAITENDTYAATAPDSETSAEAQTSAASSRAYDTEMFAGNEIGSEIGSDIKAETGADAENPLYIVIPRFFNLNEAGAKAYLKDYGITAAVDYVPSTIAAGVVCDVAFSGYWDDDNLYVLPGRAVTLRVSIGFDPAGAKPAAGNKIAYLTFDDGPSKENTYKLLDILDNYGAKATFFIVGSAITRFPGRLTAIYEAGHAIGCHSYSHVYADIYTSGESFLADIKRWQDAADAELGDFASSLYRMPGGSAKAKKYTGYDAIHVAAEELGYRIFDWTMSNNDVWSGSKSGSLTPVEYEKKCFEEQLAALDKTGRPVIVLMHETYESTLEMLPWAIELLQSKGYAFDTLNNYAGEYFQ